MSKSGRRLLVAELVYEGRAGFLTLWEPAFTASEYFEEAIRKAEARDTFKRWLVDSEFPQDTYSVALLESTIGYYTTSGTSQFMEYADWRRRWSENPDFIRWLIDDQPID